MENGDPTPGTAPSSSSSSSWFSSSLSSLSSSVFSVKINAASSVTPLSNHHFTTLTAKPSAAQKQQRHPATTPELLFGDPTHKNYTIPALVTINFSNHLLNLTWNWDPLARKFVELLMTMRCGFLPIEYKYNRRIYVYIYINIIYGILYIWLWHGRKRMNKDDKHWITTSVECGSFKEGFHPPSSSYANCPDWMQPVARVDLSRLPSPPEHPQRTFGLHNWGKLYFCYSLCRFYTWEKTFDSYWVVMVWSSMIQWSCTLLTPTSFYQILILYIINRTHSRLNHGTVSMSRVRHHKMITAPMHLQYIPKYLDYLTANPAKSTNKNIQPKAKTAHRQGNNPGTKPSAESERQRKYRGHKSSAEISLLGHSLEVGHGCWARRAHIRDR